MRDEVEAFGAAGAKLLVVGSGTPLQAQWFAEDLDLYGMVVTDPSREVFRALRTHRSLWRVLHPAVLLPAWRALRRGFRQEGVQGDALQLGGVFVVDGRSRVLFEYRSRFAGDHPPVADVLKALSQEADPWTHPAAST